MENDCKRKNKMSLANRDLVEKHCINNNGIQEYLIS